MSDTKEHILHVSFNLFLQKSFKEVTMQEIVEKTGMSKGAFYHYFNSKEQLFLEVVNHFLTELTIDYTKISKESLSHFYHDLIRRMNDILHSFLNAQNHLDTGFDLNFYTLMFDAMKFFPSFREQILKNFQVERETWVEMVRLARNQGEIESNLTDEEIADLFVYTSDGVGMHDILEGHIETMINNLLAVWDSLYKGLTT